MDKISFCFVLNKLLILTLLDKKFQTIDKNYWKENFNIDDEEVMLEQYNLFIETLFIDYSEPLKNLDTDNTDYSYYFDFQSLNIIVHKKILIDNLMAVGWIEFYFDLPAPDDLPDWRVPNEFQDTCAMYVFTALEPNSPKKTPKDPSQWKFEKFSDHSVRWTYRVTNADYDEAVRQTEERWAEKDDEE